MWQWLCDAAWDLNHLHDERGHGSLEEWWTSEYFELKIALRKMFDTD